MGTLRGRTRFGRSIDRPFIEARAQGPLPQSRPPFGRSIDRPFIEARHGPCLVSSTAAHLADQLIGPSLKRRIASQHAHVARVFGRSIDRPFIEARALRPRPAVPDRHLADQLIGPSLKPGDVGLVERR